MSCETISVRKVDYYVNNPYACIIDIREKNDYIKSHIKNAVNIPYDEIMEYFKQFDIRNRYVKMNKNIDILKDKSKIYVIYCDRGALSMITCNKMSQLGYITKTVVGGFVRYNGRYKV